MHLSDTRFVTGFVAVAAGLSIANNYLLQPVLPAIASALNIPLSATGLIAGSTQVGYMLGIMLLVPLGDSRNKRSVVSLQFLVLGLALLLAACGTHLVYMIGLGAVIGAMATNAVQLNALGFQIDPKGSTVGLVGAGIAAGILLARFMGGVLADQFGWRGMLVTVGLLMLLLALASRAVLPWIETQRSASYRQLIRGLAPLFMRHGALRRATLLGGCWFFIFSLLWVALMLHVSSAPLSLSPSQAGMLGLAGLAGLLMARPAGTWADRWGSRQVIGAGFGMTGLGALVLLMFPYSLLAIVAGVVLFDLGCFSAQVANQTSVLKIDPLQRNSLFALYMFFYYGCGAIGSISAPVIHAYFGWAGICWTSLLLAVTGGVANYFMRSPGGGEVVALSVADSVDK